MRSHHFAAFALLLLLPLAAVQAQHAGRSSPALLLARICVSEAGWECFDTRDGVAIHEVLLRGAERLGISYSSFARTYSPRATGFEPSPLRPWVGGLREDGAAPSAWPRVITRRRADGTSSVEPHPPWAIYRPRWLAVLARAREVVGYTLDDVDEWSPCDGSVHDWGGAMDRERARRIGLIEVECGETSNDFYARPSQITDAAPLVNLETDLE